MWNLTQLMAIALLAFSVGCTAGSGGPASAQSTSDNTNIVSVASVSQGHNGLQAAPRSMCGDAKSMQPTVGFVPHAKTTSTDGWLAAGQFQVEALSLHKLKGASTGNLAIAVAHFKLVAAWAGAPPAEFDTQIGCGADAAEGCEYPLEVGKTYTLLLKHSAWTLPEFNLPLPGVFVAIAAEGVFAEAKPGAWSNGISHGGIGTAKDLPLPALKAALSQAVAEVQKTGTCTSGLGLDIPAGSSDAGGTSRANGGWPVPRAGQGGADAQGSADGPDATP